MSKVTLRVLMGLMLLLAGFTAGAQDEAAAPLDPIRQASKTSIALPADAFRLKPDADGGLLLMCGDRLAILKADGITIKREIKLPRVYSDIAARADYFVAISKEDKVIELLDRRTLEQVWTKKPPTSAPISLALHPELPISYISLWGEDGGFLMLDESKRELRQDDGWIANALAVDPTGRFMIGSYMKLVYLGEKLHPGARTTVPHYESIDIMMRYHLDETGRPMIAEFRDGMGGGRPARVRMSPNGRRVVYATRSGFPQRSGNLGAWDSLDFEKLPDALEVKEAGGSSADLAYHPVLPIVVCPSESKFAVFFNADSGETLPTRLTDTDKLPQAMKADRVGFSPDGMNVLMSGKVGEQRVFAASAMRLSLTEELIIEQGPAPIKPVELPEILLADVNKPAHLKVFEQALAWVQANNVFGEDAKIVDDLAKAFGDQLKEKRGFTVLIGKGLVKSGKPTVIGAHNGVFLTAEMTDEQAKVAGLGEMQTSVRGGEKFDVVQPHKFIKLRASTIQSRPGEALAGKIEIERRGGLREALYGMTLSYSSGKGFTTAMHHMGDWLPNESVEKTFRFGNPADKNNAKPQFIVGFVEVVVFTRSRRQADKIVVSEPAMILMIAEPGE